MLNLIYHFQASQNKDGVWQPASYRVIHFFGKDGFLEMSLLKELSKSVPEANHELLTFLSLDDLKAFALRAAEELGAPDVRLISVQDYNIGIDSSRDLSAYQELFKKYGEVVVNEKAQKSKGIFKRFFS